MRLRKPVLERPAAGSALRGVATEVAAIARELVAIPAALFIRLAEFLGTLVLTAWLAIWPNLQAVWRLLRVGLARAEREVTPARATVAVAAVVAICLGVSQFFDYRAVEIGVSAYEGTDASAPAPKVDRADAGSAHLWAGVPLALIALAAIAAAARGRVAVARILVPIGLAILAISVFVDAPKGLDEDDATTLYAGAKATLETGFWAQIASASLLIVLAFLLVRALPKHRPGPARAGA